jgi:hypothetical protein
MPVFGHRRRPRLVHFTARREAASVVFVWDPRGGHALLWRVLRSEHGFAEDAFDHTAIGSGQSLVSEGALTGARDAAIGAAATYHYTVFAEDESGEWHRVEKVKLAMDGRHPGTRAGGDFEAGGSRPGLQDPHALDIAQSGWTPR